MRLRNITTGEVLASNLRKAAPENGSAEIFWSDDCFAEALPGGDAPVDVVLLDDERRVLRVHCAVAGGRIPSASIQAQAAVHLGPRTLYDFDVLVGDRLALEE